MLLVLKVKMCDDNREGRETFQDHSSDGSGNSELHDVLGQVSWTSASLAEPKLVSVCRLVQGRREHNGESFCRLVFVLVIIIKRFVYKLLPNCKKILSTPEERGASDRVKSKVEKDSRTLLNSLPLVFIATFQSNIATEVLYKWL